VSCTGDGEYFIRVGAAHEVSTLMEYRGMKLQEAAQTALDAVKKLGGSGGLIAIDKNGAVALPFNTNGCTAATSIQTASLSWRSIGRDCHVERSRDISRCYD
jgi:Asparaginase